MPHATGGLPIGAVLLKQSIADIMNVGDHGSTFAGNPLVCHAAEAVVDIITEEGFLEEVARKGDKLRADLQTVLKGNPHVKQVRGLGLIVGVQLDVVSNLSSCSHHRDHHGTPVAMSWQCQNHGLLKLRDTVAKQCR